MKDVRNPSIAAASDDRMSSRAEVLVTVGLLAALSLLSPAQDSAPTSRRERWRFHEVSDPAPSTRSIVARASDSGDSVVVLADGIVVYDVAKAWSSCTEPPKKFREQWVAAVPPWALDRIRQATAAAKAAGRELELIELLDLARVPRAARKKFLGGSAVPVEFWTDRHQDSDGSWSPPPSTNTARDSITRPATASGRTRSESRRPPCAPWVAPTSGARSPPTRLATTSRRGRCAT